MKKMKTKFSFVLQVALAGVKNGPDAADVAWFRREFSNWVMCYLK